MIYKLIISQQTMMLFVKTEKLLSNQIIGKSNENQLNMYSMS